MITQCDGMTQRGTRCRKAAQWIITDASVPSAALKYLDDRQLAESVYSACRTHRPGIAEMLRERTGVPPRVMADIDVDEFAAYVETGGITP